MRVPRGQRLKNRVSAAKYLAIGQDQMDRRFEFGSGNLWKTAANFFVLEGKEIDGVAGGVFPSGGPSAAKLAVAIEQDQWFRWRRLNAEFLRHTLNLALAR
jgi:hypothetical protein